jgi:integrase
MQKGTVIEYRHKSGDVTYRIQYRDATSKQVQETVGKRSEGMTKRKAQAILAERVSKVVNRGYRRPEPVLFGGYAWRWFEESQRLRNWKPATVRTYHYALRGLCKRFGAMRLGEIRRQHVNAYLADMLEAGDLSARTILLDHTVLHSVLARAVDEELIESNPAKGVDLPKAPRYKPRPLTVAEARAVESKIGDSTVRLAFVSLELLGLRISELLSLRWRDVDLLAHRLRVQDAKTAKGERSLSIPSLLVAELEKHFQRTAYKHDSDWVFCHPEKGSRLGADRYRTKVKAALKEAGVTDRFRPAHDLRVTSLTSGVLANEHPVKLMARAGHTSYATTRKYIELAGEVFPEEAEALAALRLGTPAES